MGETVLRGSRECLGPDPVCIEARLPLIGDYRVGLACCQWPGDEGYKVAEKLGVAVIPSRLFTSVLHVVASVIAAEHARKRGRTIARKPWLNVLAVYMSTRNLKRVVEGAKAVPGESVVVVSLGCDRVRDAVEMLGAATCCPSLREAARRILGEVAVTDEEQLERILITRSAIIAGLGKL